MTTTSLPLRVAINGFGRIGRCILRAYLARMDAGLGGHALPFTIAHINDPSPLSTLAHLLKYDSVHGTLNASVSVGENRLHITSAKGHVLDIGVSQETIPANAPWAEHGIDVVLECSGRFTDGSDTRPQSVQGHLQAGAKHVVISAPATHVDAMVVYGVNHTVLTADHRMISNASCTTNCLAPVAKILNDTFGLETGYMTTIHAYTADQNLVDSPHKDLYRARAAALSMIPTTTGAARAVGQVLPELQGRLDGTAIRVPTANVSMIDLCFTSRKVLSKDALNNAMAHAAAHDLKGVLAYNDAPLVSIDFKGNPHSAIFDAAQTQVMGQHFGRILAWYDNEWGFSNRMLDVTAHLQAV